MNLEKATFTIRGTPYVFESMNTDGSMNLRNQSGAIQTLGKGKLDQYTDVVLEVSNAVAVYYRATTSDGTRVILAQEANGQLTVLRQAIVSSGGVSAHYYPRST